VLCLSVHSEWWTVLQLHRQHSFQQRLRMLQRQRTMGHMRTTGGYVVLLGMLLVDYIIPVSNHFRCVQLKVFSSAYDITEQSLINSNVTSIVTVGFRPLFRPTECPRWSRLRISHESWFISGFLRRTRVVKDSTDVVQFYNIHRVRKNVATSILGITFTNLNTVS